MSAVAVRDLRFRWSPNGPLVLDVPAFEVAAGEQVLLAGPSGSGKTSLLNLLGGVAAPEAGAIRILDTELTALAAPARDAFRADHVGVVFQMFNLVPYLSVMENVQLACMFSAARKARAGDVAAAAAGLLDGLGLAAENFARRRVSELSIGQQQRVALARALIGDPGLIVADEPTSALDAANRDAFLELLTAACRRTGAALLFISHDAALAGRFDRRLDMTELNRAGGDAGAAP